MSGGKSLTVYRFDLNTMKATIVKHMFVQYLKEIEDECEKLNHHAMKHNFDMHYVYGEYNPDAKFGRIPTLDEWHQKHAPL